MPCYVRYKTFENGRWLTIKLTFIDRSFLNRRNPYVDRRKPRLSVFYFWFQTRNIEMWFGSFCIINRTMLKIKMFRFHQISMATTIPWGAFVFSICDLVVDLLIICQCSKSYSLKNYVWKFGVLWFSFDPNFWGFKQNEDI